MKFNTILPLLCLILLLSVSGLSQNNLLVPQQLPTIQQALNSAQDYDTISISPGTYYEHLIWPQGVYGIVMKSTGNQHNTIIDGAKLDRVLTASQSWSSSLSSHVSKIKGLTIRNGLSEGPGGIYIYKSNFELSDVVIENNINTANHADGGGMLCAASKIKLENVQILNNELQNDGWAYGAGLHVDDTDLVINNCLFEGNTTHSTKWNYGGAIYIEGAWVNDTIRDFRITNSIFKENILRNGSWAYGSGIYVRKDANIYVENCVFTQNGRLGENGRAPTIYTRGEVNCNLKLLNNTIAFNDAGITLEATKFDMDNTILWNNEFEIKEYSWMIENIIDIDYSIINGGYEGIGNIDLDPLFYGEDVLIPTEDSPCLNNGNPDEFPATDLDGFERPLPVGSYPDIGAFENEQYFGHVLCRFFIDDNKNGIKDGNEKYYSKGAVQHNDDKVHYNHNPNGLMIILKEDHAKLDYFADALELWELSSHFPSFEFEGVDESFRDTIVFGLKAKEDLSDLSYNIFSSNFRCNEFVDLTVFLKNDGTVTESGVLWLNIDDSIPYYSFEIEPDTMAVSGVYGWFFTDLIPGDIITRTVQIRVPAITQETIGSTLTFKAYIEINGSVNREIITYEDEIRCSFDPNDKLVNPNRPDDLVLFDSELTYTIRFQNTGNDYARHVVVKDTLSPLLDLESFKILHSSHPELLRTFFERSDVVVFEFNNIYLPDSIHDEENSHGFVMFNISPKSNLSEHDVINNRAGIYFDYNEPIITNTTNSIFVSEFPIRTNTNDSSILDIDVYPNPSSGLIQLSRDADVIRVFSSTGKLLQTDYNSRTIDLLEFGNSLLLLEISKDDKIGYRKIMISP